jgi:chromosome partitioning protein
MEDHNNETPSFTATQIAKMFQMTASKQTLLNAEERGDIPKAARSQRGQTSYRFWDLGQLPAIGEKIGFVRRPATPKVISVFSLKGGTSKSSVTFQVARTFALHNIRCLVIGLDAQETISQTLSRSTLGSDETEGIYHVLTENTPLESVICKTDLPTLDYIPETIELSILDMWLRNQKRKEYIIRERVTEPLLNSGNYDVILFDCNPAWSEVVTGALSASNMLLSPLGADINSLKAAKIFVSLLDEFQEEMRHDFAFLIVPTMVETNKLSQNILAKYRVEYGDLCTAASIRRSIAVQEANVLGLSLMESASASPVFQDFVGVIREINDALLAEPSATQLPVAPSADTNPASTMKQSEHHNN